MLNTTNIKMGSNTSSVTFNSPSSGTLQRSHPKSFFIKFSMGSKMEEWIFNTKGAQSALKDRENEYVSYKVIDEVEVLQVLIFGNVEYLVEVVRKDDLID